MERTQELMLVKQVAGLGELGEIVMVRPGHNIFLRLCLGLICFICSLAWAAPQKLDSIIAVVNDSIITSHELDARVRDFKRQITDNGAALPDETLLRRQVLERMIVDEVQLQLAKSQGIYIDDLGLNRVLESMARNNKTTLEEMRNILQQQGVSYEIFREQTRRDLMIRKLQKRMVYERIQISEQEINQFIEQQKQSGSNEKYRLAHILIATPENASPEDIRAAYEQAEKALAHLQSGETFREVALRFSQGRQALDGGDLGWRSFSELPPLFVDAAKNLNKGAVSSPLRSASGFHNLSSVQTARSQDRGMPSSRASRRLPRPCQKARGSWAATGTTNSGAGSCRARIGSMV